jgi:hypothetical protein
MFMFQLDVLQLAVDDVLVEYVFDKWPLTPCGCLVYEGIWFFLDCKFLNLTVVFWPRCLRAPKFRSFGSRVVMTWMLGY